MFPVKYLVLLVSSITASLCEECGTPVQERGFVASLLQVMLTSSDHGSPDPSILLALHLARQHDLEQEDHLLRELKRNIISNGSEFNPGTLALYTMALLASCVDPMNVTVESQRMSLVALLMHKLQMDIDTIGEISKMVWIEVDRRSLTDYDQISLAVLALCKTSSCLPCQTIEMVFCSAAQHSIQEEFTYSTDTLSTAALALRCMSFENCDCRTEKMMSALRSVVTRILSNVHSDGTIGDLSTTGLAIQALNANGDLVPAGSWDCQLSIRKLLEGISSGAFDNPQAVSLVVPALENRTFLDIDTLNCSTDVDGLPFVARGGPIAIDPADPTEMFALPSQTLASHPSPNSSMSLSPDQLITVNYTVTEAVFNKFTHSLVLTVPLGSSVLDVMKEANFLSPAIFSFQSVETPQGSVVTMISGVTADLFQTEWFFVTGQHVPINREYTFLVEFPFAGDNEFACEILCRNSPCVVTMTSATLDSKTFACCHSSLSLNVGKTKDLIVEFTKKRGEHVPIYIIGNQVERMKNIKLFGVLITNNLS
ncbi:cobalamin binding intrinsic factor-like [Stegostoma tigrinum]|uniref:cobalamin binding intrinsic factor-like n=1 Tax=Stegostoma tigrinum TaxID=3053191 RepID=UPI00286FEABC|nr:cobalamin binding intrinsic factor-like [Stegostoma tigrinum]